VVSAHEDRCSARHKVSRAGCGSVTRDLRLPVEAYQRVVQVALVETVALRPPPAPTMVRAGYTSAGVARASKEGDG
jgi:hypothetical protein